MSWAEASRRIPLRTILIALSGAVIAVCAWPHASSRRAGFTARPVHASQVIPWAWERPEDLRFLSGPNASSHDVEIAALARTVTLRRDDVVVTPRMQPLVLPLHSNMIAVVRVEAPLTARPSLSDAQRQRAADAIVKAADLPGVRTVQIDFDATLSQRDFYRALLSDARARLPEQTRLSITSLASWCVNDSWLKDLPIDEAVPMLFRMGRGEAAVRSYLKGGGDFTAGICRQSVGISTDEALPALPSGRRVYVFSPRPWNAAQWRRVQQEVAQ